MQRFWLSLISLFWSATALAQQTAAKPERATSLVATPDFSAVRALIEDRMTQQTVAGVSVAIARGDSILWEEGFGLANRETNEPATAHTPFYLASVTKTITATLAMMMRERGKLDLDRSANGYLRTSRISTHAWDAARATPRMLAMHTSGLTTFDLGCAVTHPSCALPSADEIIRRYGVLMWAPGERFDYSNIGYVALGEVVARAAGKDLGPLMHDELFQPLGMSESSLGVNPALASKTAVQYSWTRGALPFGLGLLSGGSSAYSSAHDLVRFGMLHAKVRPRGADRVLTDASIDTMQFATVAADGDMRYGLGWWVEPDRLGYRSVLAQGGTDAASAWLRVIPAERIAVVVLANKGVGFANEVADAMTAAILAPYAERLAEKRRREAAAAATQSGAVASRVDPVVVGSWDGRVVTESGELALSVTVEDSGAVRSSIGSSQALMGRARFADSLLRLNVPGDLTTSDSSGGRSMAFYLRPRGDVLQGTVTTRPPSSEFDGRVSYWVELKRRR